MQVLASMKLCELNKTTDHVAFAGFIDSFLGNEAAFVFLKFYYHLADMAQKAQVTAFDVGWKCKWVTDDTGVANSRKFGFQASDKNILSICSGDTCSKHFILSSGGTSDCAVFEHSSCLSSKGRSRVSNFPLLLIWICHQF
jgi:hypothetical protein